MNMEFTVEDRQLDHQEHRIARLNFDLQHSNWGVEQWRTVSCTDGSKFSLFGSEGCTRVWRQPGERDAKCTRLDTQPFQRQSLMVCAGITFNGRTELIFSWRQ